MPTPMQAIENASMACGLAIRYDLDGGVMPTNTMIQLFREGEIRVQVEIVNDETDIPRLLRLSRTFIDADMALIIMPMMAGVEGEMNGMRAVSVMSCFTYAATQPGMPTLYAVDLLCRSHVPPQLHRYPTPENAPPRGALDALIERGWEYSPTFAALAKAIRRKRPWIDVERAYCKMLRNKYGWAADTLDVLTDPGTNN